MAEAIKKISVARGHDVTRYALNCFGGAGGQHACDVADALAIKTVLIHPLSSLLSAYGMGLADISAHRAGRRRGAAQRRRRWSARAQRAARRLARRPRAKSSLRASTATASKSRMRALAALRGLRHDDRGQLGTGRRRCSARSRRRTRRDSGSSTATSRWWSRRSPTKPSAAARKSRERIHPLGKNSAPSPERAARFFSKGAWRDAEVFLRESSRSAPRVDGPALIIEPHQTIVVEDGWRAEITRKNHVILQRVAALPRREAIGAKADPVMLEIFNNLFMSIAEQMGVTLQNTAYSVNIKERLDFSCAVFDRRGSLVANAPHMPVHLGSMDRSVETIIRLNEGERARRRRFRAERAL